MDDEVPACLLCDAMRVTKTPPGALKGKLDKQETPSLQLHDLAPRLEAYATLFNI